MIARDWLHVGTPPPEDCADIIAAVASYSRLTTFEITCRSFKRNAWPRQLAMWLCYMLLPGASLTTVGRAFDHRDHTTVLYSIRRVEQRLGSRQPVEVWGELSRSEA